MRLKTLRLHGFKSFADRTTLDFREGVTVIVGSNGCGKSNIADAIRWVLGEQRASAMRGAKMEEVIFQGTVRRRPLNFAEVSLLFDNESGRVPVPQTEIDLSRKVFREGGSEYSLNRTACRLRDVQSLLRDTGLGANAYSIIEATMIETLLSDRADERRALFEEAAGIGKYKDSRRAASRRLEAADADLTRLDDLIAEVESKVRSLSRQSRKAERHRELQARRLDLEVAIALHELTRLEDALKLADARRNGLDEAERVAGTERSTSEAVLEERRIEAAELGRQRTQRSARLEAVRSRLDSREREVLLAEERRSNAELRIQQLVGERETAQAKIATLTEEIAVAGEERVRLSAVVESARERVRTKADENLEVRSALTTERSVAEQAAATARELAREIATAEGERAAAERRGRDSRARSAELGAQLDVVRLELNQMTDQTELWETQADEIRERVSFATESSAAVREEVAVLRGREQRAREEARMAEDRASTLTAQVEAREALERSYEGFSPAVSAIMAARSDFPGVHGPLADYLNDSGDERRARAIESYLGSLLQALVVDDLATARAIRHWFRESWSDGGSLLLLPLDAVERARSSASYGSGAGAAWVDALLADLVVVEGDPLERLDRGTPRVGPDGEVVDSRGVVRLVEIGGDNLGILSRRDDLVRIRKDLEATVRKRDARLLDRDKLRTALQDAEERSLEAEERRRVAEAQLKGLELDAAAHRDRRGRLQQERDSIESNLASLTATAEAADTELLELQERLGTLSQSVEEGGATEDAARGRLAELEARWDLARDEEAELRVALARSEGDLREAERRVQVAETSRTEAEARIRAIEKEATELRASLEDLSALRENAAGEIETLFAARDAEMGEIALLDARLAEVDSELAELGERARVARRRETDSAEERHKLELQVSEGRSRVERVRERLEVEWGRPWTVLVGEAAEIAEGDVEVWKQELRETTETLDGLGPVNMLAMEEHAEESRRLDFLLTQRKDLVEARDNLTAAIRQINKTAREVFQGTFEAVRVNFRRTFQSLFHGGECDIWLADPDDPLESPVEIHASPVGKKTQRIHLLSGGERTLTALALLFALYLVKPSPFCVLDEVDAPLDESNVGRFIQLLQDFKEETQFIVITHNPRTMEAADWVYGVTMEEHGISSIVGVELLGAWAQEERPVASSA
ncbi:MAG: chromosome segregation protein SMC [Gemmatimonadota bacterium]